MKRITINMFVVPFRRSSFNVDQDLLNLSIGEKLIWLGKKPEFGGDDPGRLALTDTCIPEKSHFFFNHTLRMTPTLEYTVRFGAKYSLHLISIAPEALYRVHKRKTIAAADVGLIGYEMMDYLHRCGKDQSSPRPYLILLDLNMPVKDGRAVLYEIKNDSDFRDIPIMVLTDSEDALDVIQCYELGASLFYTKHSNKNSYAQKYQRDCMRKSISKPSCMSFDINTHLLA